VRTALSFHFAYRHVRAGFGRTALSVIALALGVALVVAIQLMNAAVLDSFLDTIDGMAGRAALTVSAGEGLTFDEALVDQVAKVPGVTLAVPLVTGVAFPDDGTGELLTVHGVDVGNDAAVRVYHRGDTSNLIDDTLEFLSRKDSIILGREFAERRGLETGSKLDLVTPTGVKTFTVRGLLDPEGLAKTLGGRLVVMDVYAAEAAFTSRGQINQIDLLVAPGQEESVQHTVAAILPPGLKVEEPRLRKDVVRRTVAGFQAMLTAFALLAVLAGFLICYGRLAAIFEARTWEVGLLRAVGLRRVAVFRELLKESMVLGGAGTFLGLITGVGIGRFGLPFVAKATAINFRLPIPAVGTVLAGNALLTGMAVGLGAAGLAAVVPALRLARKQPIAALTMRGREVRLSTTGGRTWSLAFGTLTLAVALVLLQGRLEHPVLGNIATLAVAIAACAAAGPLVLTSRTIVSRLWTICFGPAGRFAARHLEESGRRAAFMVATIGVGIGVVFMFGMLAWSFEQTVVSRITTRTRADLTITSSFVSGGYQSAPLAEGLREAILSVPGVAAAAGHQRKSIEYQGGTVTLDGFDTACFMDRRVCEFVLEPGSLPDSLATVAAGRGALLTDPLSRRLQLQPGAAITLASPIGPQTFQVVGITRSDVADVVIISRTRLRAAWHDDMLTWLYVALDGGTNPAKAEAEISHTFGQSQRLLVRPRIAFVQYLADQARQAFSLLYIMEGVVFLLVLIGIGDTLATSVAERTRQLGMMRAIGLRRQGIVYMVMLEASAIAVLGILLAAVTGTALGIFWVAVQFPLVVGWALDFHFPTYFVAGGAALTLVLCVVGALFPSARAARLAVPAALRTE
jgi:putative ABC transport system permease protein